jgi:hypothetical protein
MRANAPLAPTPITACGFATAAIGLTDNETLRVRLFEKAVQNRLGVRLRTASVVRFTAKE